MESITPFLKRRWGFVSSEARTRKIECKGNRPAKKIGPITRPLFHELPVRGMGHSGAEVARYMGGDDFGGESSGGFRGASRFEEIP